MLNQLNLRGLLSGVILVLCKPFLLYNVLPHESCNIQSLCDAIFVIERQSRLSIYVPAPAVSCHDVKKQYLRRNNANQLNLQAVLQ